MRMINNYRTKNCRIKDQRIKNYFNKSQGYYKDFRLNNACILKEIPDDVLVLEDYVDQMALRTLRINGDLILHSIYIKYPELFEY